jgi:hypothetical protein
MRKWGVLGKEEVRASSAHAPGDSTFSKTNMEYKYVPTMTLLSDGAKDVLLRMMWSIGVYPTLGPNDLVDQVHARDYFP